SAASNESELRGAAPAIERLRQQPTRGALAHPRAQGSREDEAIATRQPARSEQMLANALARNSAAALPAGIDQNITETRRPRANDANNPPVAPREIGTDQKKQPPFPRVAIAPRPGTSSVLPSMPASIEAELAENRTKALPT